MQAASQSNIRMAVCVGRPENHEPESTVISPSLCYSLRRQSAHDLPRNSCRNTDPGTTRLTASLDSGWMSPSFRAVHSQSSVGSFIEFHQISNYRTSMGRIFIPLVEIVQ